MSPEAYAILESITGLEWAFEHETIMSYLDESMRYDGAAMVFDSKRKLYHHRAFFDLVAAVKDVPGVDEVRQEGETYDAWYATGSFFVRPGGWAYIGEGPMFNVGPEHPDHRKCMGPKRAAVEQIERWQPATPLILAVHIDDPCVVVRLHTGRQLRIGWWMFRELDDCWQDVTERERCRPVSGGAELAWFKEDGSERECVHREQLLKWAE